MIVNRRDVKIIDLGSAIRKSDNNHTGPVPLPDGGSTFVYTAPEVTTIAFVVVITKGGG